jgi:hypothetical protein
MVIRHKLQHTLQFNSPNRDTTSWDHNINKPCVDAVLTRLIRVIMWSLVDTPVTVVSYTLAEQLRVRMHNREKL